MYHICLFMSLIVDIFNSFQYYKLKGYYTISNLPICNLLKMLFLQIHNGCGVPIFALSESINSLIRITKCNEFVRKLFHDCVNIQLKSKQSLKEPDIWHLMPAYNI